MTSKRNTNFVEAEQAIESELVAVVEPVVDEQELIAVVEPEVANPTGEQVEQAQPTQVEVKVAEPVDDRLTVLQAEARLHINEMVIKQASRAGEITGAEKTKHGWRYTEVGLDKWAEARKAQREAATTANGTTKAKRYTIRVTDEQLEAVKEALKPFGIELK